MGPACGAQDRVHDHSWLQLADSIGLRAEDWKFVGEAAYVE